MFNFDRARRSDDGLSSAPRARRNRVVLELPMGPASSVGFPAVIRGQRSRIVSAVRPRSAVD